ncbi:MAG TPA: DUF4384 domain-containing protein, partial [Thermoanaerobaculia bacterium]|nr:DUF4384 domain-containing protein [Thermoanaerobaculia bacterium]
ATLIRADDMPRVGAKEIFFDPRRSVSEASSASRPSKVTDDEGRRIAQVSSDVTVLGLSYWIELVTSPGKRGIHVTDERTFRSGERIRIHFRGNTDGRIVIVQLGTSGASSVLFPDARKRLGQNHILANHDHVLPSEEHWFRFDDTPGTERLLILFARNQAELDRVFPIRPLMDVAMTTILLRTVNQSKGGKDLLIERETREPSEIGGYAVNVAGKPIALEIALTHL